MPNNPPLQKGALVTTDPLNPPPRTIAFQYNPESLRRTLQPQLVGGDQHDRSQMVRFAGAPIETFTVEVELDSVDSSGVADATRAGNGVLPTLYALELLAYPTTSSVVTAAGHLSFGVMEIAPAAAPLTLFVFGGRRVVPVQVTQYDIVEQAFDIYLTPIRATVSLTLRALSYSDLATSAPGYAQFLSYQRIKESLAPGGWTAGGA
jgi:hypothetical protein